MTPRRHCEERKRRSNPESFQETWIASLSLAMTIARTPVLTRPARQPQHKDQDFGHRLVKFGRDFLAEFHIGQRARQHFVFLDRNVVGLGDLDDLRAEAAFALGDDPRRAGAIVMKGYRELISLALAHDARSRKCPAGAAAGCGGAPSRTIISPGVSSARLKACVSCETPARNCDAVAGRSAHIRTDVRSPFSDTSACTGPAGSTLSEKRARQTALVALASRPPPSREISNCAIAVP